MNRGTFIPNSTYDTNLRLILSSLPSNTAAQNGFYNGLIGQEPDRVYAIGMCIPGSASDHCSECIETASRWLVQICPNQTEAYWWALDPTLCLIRYSNTSFSGSADLNPDYLVLNTANISSNLTEFKSTWDRLTLGMIAAASAAKNHYRAEVAAHLKLKPF